MHTTHAHTCTKLIHSQRGELWQDGLASPREWQPRKGAAVAPPVHSTAALVLINNCVPSQWREVMPCAMHRQHVHDRNITRLGLQYHPAATRQFDDVVRDCVAR